MIFTIRNIFNAANAEGVLAQNGAKQYYIAPYQRGYKWGATNDNDPVCLLMKDILDASENPSSEYYLQFITTKISEVNNQKVLEVIDGQQRLTTLTILLSVLAYKKQDNSLAASNNLLSYEVRPKVTEFFKLHIYQDIEVILKTPWTDYIKQFPDSNEQDIFYLFNAANKINEILSTKNQELGTLQKYVLDNVKIILNNIERNVNCEEMFSNLNDNKVDLTSSELIKGLILTKSARERNAPDRLTTYKEILEIRAVMGRQWDDLSHWANRIDIKSFFFNNTFNVLDELLLLLAFSNGFKTTKESTDKNEVFNYFQSQIKKGVSTTNQYFIDLKKLKQVLNDWFNDTEIHNLLGYLLFARTSKFSIKNILGLMLLTKPAIRENLKLEVLKILPDDVGDLEYGKENNHIHNVLLALSVFNEDNKFNFSAYSNSDISWSLEHIFPQTPETLADKLFEKDISLLKSLTKGRLNDFEKVATNFSDFDDLMNVESVYNSLSKKLDQKECEITFDEKRILYRLIKIEKLNSIGNMALLTKSDNSSNKNGMFDKKRQNIARRVSLGSFVPKHTYDVFSKLVSENMTPELNAWTEKDIEKHGEWIIKKIAEIKTSFQ